MPIDKQFAFIFTSNISDDKLLARTISHEIAHGTFDLRHTFSTKNTYTLPEGQTDNLMDYPSSNPATATSLNKYQWDLIHYPNRDWFSWLEDEEEGAYMNIAGNYDWVRYFIEDIRCARYQNKDQLDITKWAKYIDGGVPQSIYLYDDVNYGSIGVKRSHGRVDKINIQSINVSGAIVSVGNKANGQLDVDNLVKFTVRNSQLNESPELANKLKDYLTGDYNVQLNRTLTKLHGLPVETLISELLGMTDCLAGLMNAEWRLNFFEKILKQDASLSDNEIYAIRKLFVTMQDATEAEKLLTSLKDKGYDCQLIDKTKKTNSGKYELMVMALTKLYITQAKSKILEYGKNVEAENFYIWQPMGNMKRLSEAFYADPGLRTMWNSIHHTIYTYKIYYQTDCQFMCDALASKGTMVGYSIPTSEHFYVKPLETVSVYFASKNKQLGIEGFTVAMPGIFFAWLIEQGENEVNQAMKDVAVFVASCYFPISNINKALKAKSYFSLVWNSLLLTKEISDFMLSNDRFRSSAAYYLDPFIEKYMLFCQLYDCTMIFKDFADKEYGSIAVELYDQWNGISKDKKTELSKDFPEIYTKLNVQMSKIQSEIAP
jgi:hypothetical protein